MRPRYLMRHTALRPDAAGVDAGAAVATPAAAPPLPAGTLAPNAPVSETPAHLSMFARARDTSVPAPEQSAEQAPAEQQATQETTQQPAGERPRDPVTGRFLPQEGQSTDPQGASRAQEGAEAQLEGDGGADAGAEGTNADGSAKDGAPKITVLGADGAPVQLPEGVKIQFKAGGEDVALELPQLVRYAQNAQGAMRYAHQLEQQLPVVQEHYEGQLQQLTEQFSARERELIELSTRLIEDDAYLLQERERWLEHHSPENENARLREELENRARMEEEQRAQYDRARAVNGFMQQAEQTVSTMLQQFPHVSEEELLGRFNADTAPITGPDGLIPPQFFGAVQQYLATHLMEFARARNAARANAYRAGEQKAAQEREQLSVATRRAQQEAQRAKNDLAQAVRPVGGTIPAAAPQKPAIRTLEEASAHARSAFG